MEEKAVRCVACFKRLCDQEEGGAYIIKFQRLEVKVKGEIEKFVCPRCGNANVPPFYTKPIAPMPAPPDGHWPAKKPMLPPLRPR